MRRETEIEQVKRGEEINKWEDTSRKTDRGRQKHRRQQSGGVEDPDFHLLFNVPLPLGWKERRCKN